jgi:hypothetical protein
VADVDPSTSGTYRMGPLAGRVALDFALRRYQFGILVTTSYLANQAYQELRSDRHPVVIIASADLAAILAKAGVAQILL